MATSDPLPHGPDVLDPLFQQLVARRIPLGKAMREIMESLQGGDLCLSVCVAGGVRALQPMHFATKEEEEQAREEYRAAVARHDYDAAEDAIYGTSPPGGIIGPLGPEDWGHKVTLVVSERRLLIKWLDPTFCPEHYSFAIINPEVLDRLVAAACSAHASSAAGSRQLPRLQEMRRAGMLKGVRQKMAADWAPNEYPPDGDIPSELTASEMAEAIQQWRTRKGLARLTDEALRRFCARFLKAYREARDDFCSGRRPLPPG
jgi:hypothetical protein